MAESVVRRKHCLITGAGGFIGQALTAALLQTNLFERITLTDVVEPAQPSSQSSMTTPINCIKTDLTSEHNVASLFTPDVDCIYLLHGIMSGQAEADLDLGLKVNVDSVRLILDHLRRTNAGVKVIFTSSTAVYGPPPTAGYLYTEETAPEPRSSYGSQKHIIEVLLNDYARRGLLDGMTCRLPTVVVRPGKPTGAASSFASGILREPLNGFTSTLPVPRTTRLWICSPQTVVRNLIHALTVGQDLFGNKSRIVNLPGISVTVQDMLDALESVGGRTALSLVQQSIDAQIQSIVESWPAQLDTVKAFTLKFKADTPFHETLRSYAETLK